MVLGREPIQFFRLQGLLLSLAAPSLCFGQSKPPPEENTWTTPTQKSVSDTSAEGRSGELPTGPGEIADPWNARQPDDESFPLGVTDDEQPAREPLWPEDDRYERYRETAPHRQMPEMERYRSGRKALAPNYSLWFGIGAGWTLPFGDLWGACRSFDVVGRCATIASVPTHDYVAQGPALEMDLGARLSRYYNFYGLWEHSWLGAGSAASADRGQPQHGDTDFFALGLRVSTDPDDLGFMLDIAVGSRRMRARWADGTELQMTDAPFETRMGIGADVRLSDHWSLTPMLSLGLGSFGKAEWVLPDHTVQSATQPGDVALTHGWVGLQMAAHVDALGTR